MERKRLRQLEEREAAGESFWRDDLPRPARVKIAAHWRARVAALAHKQDAVVEHGIRAVMEYRAGIERPLVVPDAWLEVTDTDLSLSYLEAMMFSFENFVHVDMTEFEERVNEVFNDHRIAFRLVERRAVPLASDELHAEVVEPTLRLLIESRFKTAHGAYLKALEEIANNDPGDAITDAGTALQETLLAMGCKGMRWGHYGRTLRRTGWWLGTIRICSTV